MDVLPSTPLVTQESSGVLKTSFTNSQPSKQVRIDAPAQTIDCIGPQADTSGSTNLPAFSQLSCPGKYADHHFNQFQIPSVPSTTPFDQVYHGKYRGFSSSTLSHPSSSNAIKKKPILT